MYEEIQEKSTLVQVLLVCDRLCHFLRFGKEHSLTLYHLTHNKLIRKDAFASFPLSLM